MKSYKVFFTTASGASVKYYTIEDGLDNIKISSRKLCGDEDFRIEPQRLEFDLVLDDWLTEHIFKGKYIYPDTTISEYEVKLYCDTSWIFLGVINLLNCSEDGTTAKITAYDKLYLLNLDINKYAESEHGLMEVMTPLEVLEMGKNIIETNMPGMQFPIISSTILPEWYVDEVIYDENYNYYVDDGVIASDYRRRMVDFGFDSSTEFYRIYVNVIPQTEFNWDEELEVGVFVHTGYAGSVIVKKYVITNKLNVSPYEENGSVWSYQADLSTTGITKTDADNIYDGLISEAENNVNYSEWINNKQVENGLVYHSIIETTEDYPPILNHFYRRFYEVRTTGNIVSGSVVFDLNDNNNEYKNLLKAILVMYNQVLLTTRPPAQFNIKLVNRDYLGDIVHNINITEVLDLSSEMVKLNEPDYSVLEVLYGSTDNIKNEIKQWYPLYGVIYKEYQLTIDDNGSRNIDLFQTIVYDSDNYTVMEITYDIINEEIIVNMRKIDA